MQKRSVLKTNKKQNQKKKKLLKYNKEEKQTRKHKMVKRPKGQDISLKEISICMKKMSENEYSCSGNAN